MAELKVYKASAGSGKTYTLALEYIKELLLSKGKNTHRHILAVTFTKDATGEMKDRILAELYGLAFACKDSQGFLESVKKALKEAGSLLSEQSIQEKSLAVLQEILHDYSRLQITTIDSFFQKVLRNLARELGKGSKFNLEMNSFKVLSEAVAAMIENANENPQVLDWLTTYIEEKLDEGDNWRIQKDILNFSQCIFNENFQERERELKRQLDSNPKIFEELWKQHVRIQKSCKDFFKKAYTGICSTMDNTGLTLADFSRKGTVINFLHKLSEGDIAGANPNSKTVQDCLIDATKWASSKNPRMLEITDMAYLNFMPLLNECVEKLVTYNTSRMITNNIYQLGLIWDITNEINKQNESNNRFMLADTALFLNRMIDDSDAPFIYEKIGAEIRHVMIDEFQDTSRIQWKNFRSLLSNIIANNYFSMIVGDVKQSIYRWRNGDWSILNGIERELNVNSKTLEYNFRSEKIVVDFNNRLFTHAASLLNDKFYEVFDKESVSPFPSAYNPKDVAQQTPKKTDEGHVSIDFIPDKTDEGKYNDLVLDKLLTQIQTLHQAGIAPENICILTRTNRSIINIASFLSAQKEQYPELSDNYYLSIVSNEAFQLNSSPAIRILIESLRVLVEPENVVHKAQLQIFTDKLIRKTSRDLTQILGDNNDFALSLSDNHETLTCMPLFELIGHLYRLFDLERIEGQSNYMFAFYDAVSNYLKDYPADILAFLKYWDEELQTKSVPSGTGIRGIRAMTIHRSKGLQFHTVLVPYCDWGLYPEKSPVVWCSPKAGLCDLELLPVRYSQKMHETVFLPEYKKETAQSWLDNLNLLYVAFTRAERNLLIIAKQKKKLASLEDMKNVSDILQCSVTDLEGNYDEEKQFFGKGTLSKGIIQEKEKSNNILKSTPETLPVSFVSEAFSPEKSIFKQSNQSREFIRQEDETITSRNEYIREGNIMHSLFSGIRTLQDIVPAVEHLIFSGIISKDKKDEYVREVTTAIREAKIEHWFSDQYTIYNECAILIEENGVVTHKQPDRVLTNDKETIIIDYKFGEPHRSHQKQVLHYAALMREMGYDNISAYVWYVKKNNLQCFR